MENSREIDALLHLIDDPDEEVFGVVTDKIVGYGKNIIPNLEHLWETTPDEGIQQRIELLIHKLHYKDLAEDMRQWGLAGHHDLMEGTILVSRFQYPDLAVPNVRAEMEKVRRNIWLELNNYLTPLEQINIVTSILYSYYGLKGTETNYKEPNEFLAHKALETKRGNQIANGLIYLVLCEMLDIPVRAIQVPKQFVLAYFRPGYSDLEPAHAFQQIEFFIDPASGQVFTHADVENYFKRIGAQVSGHYFKPRDNKEVLQAQLLELGRCFKNESDQYKQQELTDLAALLSL